MQESTLGPPNFTCQKYRICGGSLHGICRVQDPEADAELKRVCLTLSCPDKGKGKGWTAILRALDVRSMASSVGLQVRETEYLLSRS